MIYEQTLQVLTRLLEGTKSGALSWEKDKLGDWYTARTKGREISIRFLHFETTNGIDARRHSLQLFMPGPVPFFLQDRRDIAFSGRHLRPHLKSTV
jgi:hypothetical protein